MINEKNKFLTLSGLLSADIFISTGECPDATTDHWKQPLYYRMFPPAINIIPTSLAVALLYRKVHE